MLIRNLSVNRHPIMKMNHQNKKILENFQIKNRYNIFFLKNEHQVYNNR